MDSGVLDHWHILIGFVISYFCFPNLFSGGFIVLESALFLAVFVTKRAIT